MNRVSLDSSVSEGGFRCVSTRVGFTLLELIVVIAIISVLLVKAILMVGAVNGSRNIEMAGKLISDQLNLARQEAITRNRAVKFRLYKFKDTQDGANSMEIRGLQFFMVDGDNFLPISKVIFLPQGTVISEQPGMSSLVTLLQENNLPGAAILRASTGCTYREFTFHADGSTDLTFGTNYFLTVSQRIDTKNPPKNYYMVSILPSTGRTQAYRP